MKGSAILGPVAKEAAELFPVCSHLSKSREARPDYYAAYSKQCWYSGLTSQERCMNAAIYDHENSLVSIRSLALLSMFSSMDEEWWRMQLKRRRIDSRAFFYQVFGRRNEKQNANPYPCYLFVCSRPVVPRF